MLALAIRPKICSVKNLGDTRDVIVIEFKSRSLAKHETFNGRLKCFGVLSQTYRHDVDKHELVFNAVAVIVQAQLMHGHPLFEL